jgi:hypothetical protein
MRRAGIDVIRTVWCQEYESLRVAPSADCPGFLTISTPDRDAEEFYGKVDLTLPRELAVQLAEAILACAGDCIK